MIPAIIAVAAIGIYAATRTQTVSIPLGNIERQTAKEGESIRKVWGISRPIAGNLVACQEPPRIQKKKQKSGGKGGGGGSSTTIEIPHRTYAILICEGTITSIRRAWRNNKLVYDARENSTWGAKNNPAFLKRFKFYIGDYEQLPDASLQKVFGADKVPAMRGRAYMVADDEDLQDTAGAVPNWRFEVVRNPPKVSVLNSANYGIGYLESGDFSAHNSENLLYETVVDSALSEASDISATLQSIEIKGVQIVNVTESGDVSANLQTIEVKAIQKINPAFESGDVSANLQTITIKPVIKINYAVESGDISANVQSITLG